MEYISSRKKVTEYLSRYLKIKDFEAEENHFIKSICIDLGVKETLVKECLNLFIETNIIYRNNDLIINSQKYKKNPLDISIDEEMKGVLK